MPPREQLLPKSERFEMRLDPELGDRVDAWRSKQNDVPSRSEAVRRLIDIGLTKEAAPQISDGEKLMLFMLGDIHKATVGKKKGEIEDVDFINSAIVGGHYWALRWNYSGIFHDYADTPQTVTDVVNILDMWSFLEEAHSSFDAASKALVEKEAEPFGKHVTFTGFDGNNETNHMGIARFLVDKLGRFSRFKGRDLNSHYPSIPGYLRMFAVFDPIRASLIGHGLSPAQVIAVLNAKRHPDHA